jgi:hypothetical protein
MLLFFIFIFGCFYVEICLSKVNPLGGVLVTQSLSVELFSMFWQDWEVAGLLCHFSPLAWGYNSAITNSSVQ